MIWWNCQRAASNAEAIERTDGFAVPEMLHLTLRQSDALAGWRILSKNCIWHWNNQMHWRIFEFLSVRLHSTLKRLDALTDWRWCQKSCTQCWNDRVHWRVFFFSFATKLRAASCWRLKWRRQTDRQTKRQKFVVGCKYVDWDCRTKFDWWNDAGRQSRRNVGFVDNVASFAKQTPSEMTANEWSMFLAGSCQTFLSSNQIDLIGIFGRVVSKNCSVIADCKTKRVDWFLDNRDRDFFETRIRLLPSQWWSIVVFLERVSIRLSTNRSDRCFRQGRIWWFVFRTVI